MRLSILFALACALACAQGTPLSGSYGFLVNAYLSDTSPAESSGLAILGVMNFDGAGNVAGSDIVVTGASGAGNQQSRQGTFTGTYSTNPDGTGEVDIATNSGVTITFATVLTDGGRGIQMVTTACSCGIAGIGIPLQGTAQSLTGSLPMSLFLNGAAGSIPLSLTASSSSGAVIYTASNASGTGTVPCGDGTIGTWTATVPMLTVFGDATGLPFASANGVGDFALAISSSYCESGPPQIQTLIGYVNGNPGPGNAVNLTLVGPGGVLGGFARTTAPGVSLNGSYGFQIADSALPAETLGTMQFDGAGNANISLTYVGASGNGNNQPAPVGGTKTGTYNVNPDGTGTITFAPNLTFSFVMTDGGSRLLMLNSSARPNASVTFGTASIQ